MGATELLKCLSSLASLIKEHQLSVSHGDLLSVESSLVCYTR